LSPSNAKTRSLGGLRAYHLVPDWLQVEHVPEGHPALLVVEQLHRHISLFLDGSPDLVHCLLVRLRTLQEAAVAPQDEYSVSVKKSSDAKICRKQGGGAF
jgi:hypothetical protein